MKIYRDQQKDNIVKQQKGRNGIGFEKVVEAIIAWDMLAFYPNPKPKYKGQSVLIVAIDNYAYQVPCQTTDKGLKLITVFPDRVATKVYNLQ